MKAIFSFLFVLITCLCNAQVVDLVGNVIVDNVEEDYNKSGIHIINQSTKELYTTTSDGSFKMKVQLNDELLFKSDFTQNRTIKITSSILSKGYLNVHLDLEVIELAEANLKPLKKNLKENVWTSDTSKDQLYKSLGLDPNLQYVKIDPTYTSQVSGGYGPISSLIGIINGSTKKAKRTYAAMKRLNEKDKIKSYFEESFFTDYLKIPTHKISEFISYCYVNFDLKKLVVNGRYVEIEEILKDNASAYLELINIKEK